MATKYVAAAAAVVALANTTEAMYRPMEKIQTGIIQDKMYRPHVIRPQDKMFRPIQDKMLRQDKMLLDEEQLVTTGAVGGEAFNINLNHNSAVKDGRNWKEELKKAADLWKQAREAGFFDEDAEQADWNFNAGVSGGAGGRPQWNASIGAKWEEDEEQLVTTGAVGDEKFNINLNHNSAVKDGRNWKEELKKAADLWKQAREAGFFDEEQADWNFNAGIQGGAGGRPQWNASIGAKWEEDEEQLVTTGAVGDDKFNINLNHNSAVKDGRNWKDELKKAADLWKQAREAGFFDEDAEQADWNFNAGVSGGAGGRPQWNASIGAKWEEEEQRFGRGGFPSSTGPYNPSPPSRPWDEEQADWNFNAGIQGGAGGKPQWSASIGAKWDEDAEQFSLSHIPGRVGNSLVTIRLPNGEMVTGWESSAPNCVIMQFTNGLFCGTRVGYASHEEDEEAANHEWKGIRGRKLTVTDLASFEDEEAANHEWKGIKGRKLTHKDLKTASLNRIRKIVNKAKETKETKQ